MDGMEEEYIALVRPFLSETVEALLSSASAAESLAHAASIVCERRASRRGKLTHGEERQAEREKEEKEKSALTGQHPTKLHSHTADQKNQGVGKLKSTGAAAEGGMGGEWSALRWFESLGLARLICNSLCASNLGQTQLEYCRSLAEKDLKQLITPELINEIACACQEGARELNKAPATAEELSDKVVHDASRPLLPSPSYFPMSLPAPSSSPSLSPLRTSSHQRSLSISSSPSSSPSLTHTPSPWRPCSTLAPSGSPLLTISYIP